MPKKAYSRIIAGAMKWGIWGASLNTSELSNLISKCYEIGVTTFDHADIYGGHTTEKEWGNAYAKTNIGRDSIQIISKCGIMMPSSERPNLKTKHYDVSKQHIISSVDQSLKNLKTDYLDLLLIHRPSPLMNPDIIKEAIEKLKSEGKIIDFGVSNFTTSQMELVSSKIPLTANQIELSMSEMSALDDGTLDYCITNNVSPMVWSPLGGGALFSPSSNPLLLNQRERLNNVAQKYGWTVDEMVYLFILHHPANIKIVTGSSKIERIKIAVDCLNKTITDSQWFEIWTAAKGYDVA